MPTDAALTSGAVWLLRFAAVGVVVAEALDADRDDGQLVAPPLAQYVRER